MAHHIAHSHAKTIQPALATFDECADDADLCYAPADCEARGRFWYDSACHETPDTAPIDYDLQVCDIYREPCSVCVCVSQRRIEGHN